ncbi:MAG: hypothetical protein ILO36_07140, partial [Abditibacteriota bacterium]|nr:hypothetical protein [Abditibacteriota bacterium]
MISIAREEELRVQDNIEALISILPDTIRKRLLDEPGLEELLEVVLDLGRAAEARYSEKTLRFTDMT